MFYGDSVDDRFDCFCVGLFFPDNYDIFVVIELQLIYFYDHINLRRKGRMTDEQKIWRAKSVY